MAAKFFTGLPLDGPDPECALGHGEPLLAARDAAAPRSPVDHSRRPPPDRACNEDPLADFWREARWRAVATGSSRSPRRSGARANACPSPSTTRWSPGRSAARRSTTTSGRSASSASCRVSPPAFRAARDLATTVLGQQISMPVVDLADRGPGGAPRTARSPSPARRRRRGPPWVSARSRASRSRRSSRPTRRRSSRSTGSGTRERDRRRSCERARRGRRGGAHRHARLDVLARPRLGQPDDPRAARPASAMARFAPRGARAPALAARVPAQTAARPTSPRRTWRRPAEPPPTFFGAYGEWMQTAAAVAGRTRWLREQWGGPFMLKGVMRVDDARRAVEVGADAISVSNHGGNNLDGTPAAIRALPAIAEAVGGRDRGPARRRRSGAAATSSRRSRSAPAR